MAEGVQNRALLAVAALCLALLSCGCATSRQSVEMDAQHPAVSVTTAGVFIGDAQVRPEQVSEYLEDLDVPHDRTIHILLSNDVRDLRLASFLMACLAKAGYTRPVLVTKRHAESVAVGKKKPKQGQAAAKQKAAPKQPAKIRYKKKWE
ncbi:MAG: hypothetical protein IKE55_00430 [Kiritimatiellae bacterium]|jgi:hypothetical protein|nr:hypothetical protein [Kiritimatiellia bacterium]